MEIEEVEIESIEFYGEEYTIDICVADTHMFFANDIYTHNSGFKMEIGDIDGVGKAIEVFQKADQLIFWTQTPEQKANGGDCIGNLLKNRLGPANIPLLCQHDPNKGIFIEKEELNPLVLLSGREKDKVISTVNSAREKLKTGLFDSKK